MTVRSVRVVDSGVIDDRDCAFPQVAVAGGGELVCVYCHGGGQFASGISEAARSLDGGRTWIQEGPVGPAGPMSATGSGRTYEPVSSMLRASSRWGSDLVFAYGARSERRGDDRFGERPVDPILCVSRDRGRTWTAPRVLDASSRMLEISHGVLPLSDGRLLAPAATIERGRLGERVLMAQSDDDGTTWGPFRTVLSDPTGRRGYLEHKLADLGGGRVLLTAWTVEMDSLRDLPNTAVESTDGGRTWGEPVSTGINGQTLSVLPLCDDRILVLYNRRYGRQGVVAALATVTAGDWLIHEESLVHDAHTVRERPTAADGVEEMVEFTFGFPTAVRLPGGDALVTFWAGEYGRVAVRWARLRIAWP
jgi:hypothetical protein